MNDKQTTRRRFLVAVVALSAIPSGNLGPSMLRITAAWAKSHVDVDDETLAAMVRMARLLFPHDAMSDAVYAGVLDGVLANTASNGSFAGTLDAAERALNAARDGDWLDLDESEQIAIMRELEGEAFFVAIQDTVRAGIYLNPVFWDQIGYAGSSKEFGGYLNRGAGDIDWLPEDVS